MTKQDAISKIEERLTYCLKHADSDEEARLITWIGSHLAAEFNTYSLMLNGEFVLSDS
jgi:hypothetical protein